MRTRRTRRCATRAAARIWTARIRTTISLILRTPFRTSLRSASRRACIRRTCGSRGRSRRRGRSFRHGRRRRRGFLNWCRGRGRSSRGFGRSALAFLTLDVFAFTRSCKCAGPSITLFVGKAAADSRRRSLHRSRGNRSTCDWRLDHRSSAHGLWLSTAGAGEFARLALLDDYRLRPAVAEILSDVAALDGPLQRQRLARASAERLVGVVLGLCHALLVQTPKSRFAAFRMHPYRTGSAVCARPRSVPASWLRLV